MSDDTPLLAALHEGIIDRKRLQAVLEDISAHTEILVVLTKGSTTSRSGESSWTLDQAEAALVAAEVRGIQVRYQWQNQEWWDTIIRHGEHFRLVRVQQDYT